MKFVFLILLISVLWTSVKTSEVRVITFVPPSSAIKLGLSYNLQCTVTGNIQNRAIVFERNNTRICQRHWYRSGNVFCNTTSDVLSGYECQCLGLKNDTLVYRLMIKSFSTEDATRWRCSSVDSDGTSGTMYISNDVFLYYGVIKLAPFSSAIKLDRSYNLECSVTGNIKNRPIVFERNNVTICQILLYTSWNAYCNTAYDILSGYECQCIRHKNDTFVYRVMIKSFSRGDATRWSCSSVDSDGTSGPVYVSNYVYLYFSGVTLSGNKEMFDADGLNSITFTCTTSNMTGRVEFTSINKTSGEPIENNLTVSKHYDAYSQELIFIPHWYQDGNKVVCKAFNADTNMATTSNVKIMNLTYPPLAHPVIKQDNNSNSTLDSEILTREGAMLHLSCEVPGGKPRVSNVTIVCDGVQQYTTRVQDGAVGRISFKVWRNIHNHTCLCSATHITGRYNLTTTVTILVNYPPNVTVRHEFNSSEKSLRVICEAEGRPDNYSFSPFTHFWNENTIRELPGQLVETNKSVVLTIEKMTYADSGRYQCGVSNGIEDLNKVKVQHGSTSLVVDEKPILDYGGRQNQAVSALLGESVVLKRKIFSKSNITNHTWTHRGSYQNLTGQLSKTEVTLNIYNITVKDHGYSITLKISNINNYTLRSYTLNVCNSVGCNHFHTTLKTIIPEPGPTSNSVVVAAATGVTVVVILVVIIVVVIVILRKRRNSTTNTHSSDDNHEYVNQDNNQHGERPAVEYVNTVNDVNTVNYVNTVNDVNNVYDVNTVNIQTNDPHVYQTLRN